jgi:hypothetical protein
VSELSPLGRIEAKLDELLETNRAAFRSHDSFRQSHETWLHDVELVVRELAGITAETAHIQKRFAKDMDELRATVANLALIVLKRESGGTPQ